MRSRDCRPHTGAVRIPFTDVESHSGHHEPKPHTHEISQPAVASAIMARAARTGPKLFTFKAEKPLTRLFEWALRDSNPRLLPCKRRPSQSPDLGKQSDAASHQAKRVVNVSHHFS